MGWRDLRNRWDFALRSRLRWHRRGARLVAEPKLDLFAHLPADRRDACEATELRLRQTYHLDDLAARTDRANYRENLYYLDLLERAFTAADVELPDPLAAADIGVSHWFYVQALWSLLSHWRADQPRRVELTGWEVDAWVLHSDLRARYDHALAHLAARPGVRFVPGAFTRAPERFGCVTLLFPFVFPRDHERWRLPRPLFDPERLLTDAWESLATGGTLVVVNQGAAEAEAQRELLGRVGIEPRAWFVHESSLYQYRISRNVGVARRP